MTTRIMKQHSGSSTAQDSLHQIGRPSITRILSYFALRPNARPHARYLQRVLGLGGASLQRDLERLLQLGIIDRITDGRFVRYRAAPRPKFWAGVRLLLADTGDPTGLVREALRDVQGIEAAFVFGSVARGSDRPDSDIDVFVVEESSVDRGALYRQLAEAGLVLGRELNPVRYTKQALAERLGDPTHVANSFVRDVLRGPKRWVAGSPEAIRPLATAAGISMSQEPDWLPAE